MRTCLVSVTTDSAIPQKETWSNWCDFREVTAYKTDDKKADTRANMIKKPLNLLLRTLMTD